MRSHSRHARQTDHVELSAAQCFFHGCYLVVVSQSLRFFIGGFLVNWLKLFSVRIVNCGCPGGTRRLPNNCQARTAATYPKTPMMTALLFIQPTERSRSRLPAKIE